MAETKKTTTKTATTTKKAPAKTTATKTTAAKTVKATAPKVEDKQPVKVAETKKVKQIKVTYTKSVIGYNKNQAKVLVALGLKKLNSFNVLPDNACVRGMIHKVAHLVTVEEVK